MTLPQAFTAPSKPLLPRIAIVADVPKKNSVYSLSESFYWTIARALKDLNMQVTIDHCLLASVLQVYPNYVPTGKDFDFESPKYLMQTAELERVLDEFDPHVIVCLGSLSLEFFKRGSDSLDDERGAPFLWKKRLCIATYHPRDIFMRYHLLPLLQADLGKAIRLGKSGWRQPEYNIVCLPSYEQTIKTLEDFVRRKPYLSVDIETDYKTGIMTCIGFAYSTTSAFVIPFVSMDGRKPYWLPQQSAVIYRLLDRVLRTCPCVGHNAAHFDHAMLAKVHGLPTNFIDDTMFAQWSCYPEFSKSLSFCSSLYTDNPYWKDELKLARSGKIPRWKEFEYNGRDCIITLQCAVALGKELKQRHAGVRDHYKFNICVSRAYQYMSMRGAFIDREKLMTRTMQLQALVEQKTEELHDTIGFKINVKSPKQVKEYLYSKKRLGLPERTTSFKNPDGTTDERVTADYLTTLYLGRTYPQYPAVTLIGELRKIHKRLSSLTKIKYDALGICRWNFNVVGTETGRSSGYKPYDGLGIQPQNVDRRERDLFLPPDGYWWCKADLEGADSVTVAACLEALGDPRLHEDIKAGIKPAQTLALAMMLGSHVLSWSQSEILAALKDLKTLQGKTLYRVAKAINHGSAYMLSPGGMHTNIFKQSDGELFITPEECKKNQQLLFARYDYPLYHRQVESLMRSGATLRASSGQERVFYGRADNSTLRKMLAYLPQAHTAYVTNMAIKRMYEDPANRTATGLFLQLCNQVHDETDFYVPVGHEKKAADIFNRAKDVPLSVWGVDFTIQFDAEYGTSWGHQEHPLV